MRWSSHTAKLLIHQSPTRHWSHSDWTVMVQSLNMLTTVPTARWLHSWGGSWWPSGLCICLARQVMGLWVQFLCRHIPHIFLSGWLLCRSRCKLSKFNCNTLCLKTVPFSYSIIFNYIQLAFVLSNWSQVCVLIPLRDAWCHFLLNYILVAKSQDHHVDV